MEDLAARWQQLLAPWASAAAAGELFGDLAARYRDPHRHYHTLRHVAAVLDCIDEIAPGSPPAVRLAAWLHDVVYDPRAGDNEARSGEYGRDRLASLGVPTATVDETVRLILLTRTHETTGGDLDGFALLDADLAVLAAAPADYDNYVAAIRREYAWVPEAEFRAGRQGILRRLEARPRIYYTPAMRQQREAAARMNLAREIALLGA